MSGIHKAQSCAEVIAIVKDWCFRGCQIPEQWNETLVNQIIDLHLRAMFDSIGKIELVYRRSIHHADELLKYERERRDK